MTALTCPVCGAPVQPSKGYKPRKYCSRKCAVKAKRMQGARSNRKNDQTVLAAKSLKRMQEEREDGRFMVLARLAKRDLDYAASPCAARVTVDCVRTTDGRTLVVETRGRSCIGCMSAGVIRSA